MSRSVAYGRTKAGHSTYFCNDKRRDGEPCGNRVQTPRGVCWVHARAAERAYRERAIQK